MNRAGIVAVAIVLLTAGVKPEPAKLDYLSWSAEHAAVLGRAAYIQGRVGRLLDARFLKTERAYNYKLAATWMTPAVIRASARLIQLAERLPDEKTIGLVADAERVTGTVVMVEVDPREDRVSSPMTGPHSFNLSPTGRLGRRSAARVSRSCGR